MGGSACESSAGSSARSSVNGTFRSSVVLGVSKTPYRISFSFLCSNSIVLVPNA